MTKKELEELREKARAVYLWYSEVSWLDKDEKHRRIKLLVEFVRDIGMEDDPDPVEELCRAVERFADWATNAEKGAVEPLLAAAHRVRKSRKGEA